jgi:hypothetical protein
VSKKGAIWSLYTPRLYAFLSNIKHFSFLSQISDNSENKKDEGTLDLNI